MCGILFKCTLPSTTTPTTASTSLPLPTTTKESPNPTTTQEIFRSSPPIKTLESLIRKRGPDSYRILHEQIHVPYVPLHKTPDKQGIRSSSNSDNAESRNANVHEQNCEPGIEFNLTFAGSVLALRAPDVGGEADVQVYSADERASFPNAEIDPDLGATTGSNRNITVQPLRDATTGDVFLWNGEAWRFRGSRVVGNDTEVVFRALVTDLMSIMEAVEDSETVADVDADVADAVRSALQQVEGPFSFLFYHSRSQSVFYGRDPFGRRSLVVRHGEDGMCCASVSTGNAEDGWQEVGTGGFYALRLSQVTKTQIPQVQFVPWHGQNKVSILLLYLSCNLRHCELNRLRTVYPV
jgi:hypothetical protein